MKISLHLEDQEEKEERDDELLHNDDCLCWRRFVYICKYVNIEPEHIIARINKNISRTREILKAPHILPSAATGTVGTSVLAFAMLRESCGCDLIRLGERSSPRTIKRLCSDSQTKGVNITKSISCFSL